MKIHSISFVLGTLLCFACSGYHSSVIEHARVDVPYAKGDSTGELTSAVIKTLSSDSSYIYDKNGDLTLELELFKPKQENISLNYERNQEGGIENKLVPSENSLSAKVFFQLIDNNTNRSVLGPIRLEEKVYYDFDFQPIQSNINIFSLGQLSYIDEATQAALSPLYAKLAEQIVTFLNNYSEGKRTEQER